MLLKNKLFKSTLSILLVLLLTITCMPISASAAKLEVVNILSAPIRITEYTNGVYTNDYNPETGEYDLEYYLYEPLLGWEYTVILSDGSTISNIEDYSKGFYYNDEFYSLNIKDNQSYTNQWTAGNTYIVTVTIDNCTVDVPVEIIECPFASIEATPVSVMEYTRGHYEYDYNEETDKCDLEYYHYDVDSDTSFTLTLKDGTTLKSDGSWFRYDGVRYDINISTNQSYKNQWIAGNTYAMEISLLNLKTEAPVTITECPIENIEIEPITIAEGAWGNYTYDYNPETDDYDLEYFKYKPEAELEYTITFKDGSTIIEAYSTRFEYNDTKFDLVTSTNQSYKNQWTAGNTYTMNVLLGRFNIDVPVTITESPFESIEIKPISILEGTCGDYEYDYNPETDDWDLEYYRYDLEYELEYTITLKDGSSFSYYGTDFFYNGQRYNLSIIDLQSYENQWTVGNTYTIEVLTGNIFNTDVPVTITGSAFKSIEIKPISITEFTCGDYEYDYNPETDDWDLEYYHYNLKDKLEYTITLTDGSTIENYGSYFYYDGQRYDFSITTSQSYENQWTAGNTYTMEVSLDNFTVDVPVSINSYPFEKIEIKPISIIKETHGEYESIYNPETGDYDLVYYHYWPEDIMEYTITLNDGTTITGTGNEFEYNDEWYYLDYETVQGYDNQWTAGNTYTMTVSLNNISVNVPVTINEMPFESIKVEPITLYEEIDGEYHHDYNPETDDYDLEYFEYYNYDKLKYTVTLNDGSTIEGKGSSFYYNDEEFYIDYYTDQSYENQWTVGNTYTMTVSLNDISVDVPVTIAENPIKSIEFEPISIIEKTTGSYVSKYNPETGKRDPEFFKYYPENKMQFTVTLNDGTKIDGRRNGFEYDGTIYTFDHYITDHQSYGNQWTVGNTYTFTVYLNNISAEAPVTIIENPFKSIEIKPITIEEFTNGDYVRDFIPGKVGITPKYYCYSPKELIEYTITLNDGSKISGTGDEFDYAGDTYNLNIKTEQSYENQWTAGNTYTMTVGISTTSVDVPVTITSSTPTPTLKGDVDNDGFITIKDATMAQEHVARLRTLTDTSALNADVDGSGDINIVDATYIQMYVAKQITSFDKI